MAPPLVVKIEAALPLVEELRIWSASSRSAALRRQHGAEDLLPSDLRAGLGLDDRRADEVAVLGAAAAAVEDELVARALLDPAEDALVGGEMTGPTSVSGSAPSPTTMAPPLSASALQRLVAFSDGDATSSPGSAARPRGRRRETPSAAESSSASGMTMTWFFAPPSA